MVLGTGAPGEPDSVFAYGPFVLRESDGSYKMWYTGFDGGRLRLLFADSPDGIAWTKRGVAIDVLTPPYNFDSVVCGSVLKEGTTYDMWFTAGYWTGPAGFWQQVYHATSTDGRSWSIDAPALGLGPPGAWDDTMVAYADVVRDAAGLYHLYYLGWDGTLASYLIGLATSNSPTGFIRYGNQPVVDLGPPGSWDDTTVGEPAVVIGSPWTMYYPGGDGTVGQVGLAFSDDQGYTWTKSSGNPWLAPNPQGGWDGVSLGATSHPVLDPTGDRLYYTGYDGARTRIGYVPLSAGLVLSGSYVSRVFDSGGSGTTWSSLAWNASTPAATSLDFSIRAGDTLLPDAGWTPWAPISGPSSRTPLSLPRARYVQYRVQLGTSNVSVGPTLHDVSVSFARNQAPLPVSLSPGAGIWLRTHEPTFQWNTQDSEGDPQSSFEIQLSQNPGFANFLSSGVRAVVSTHWQTPAIAEGHWYWRVRVADSYGAWSAWRMESFGIDVTSPQTSASLAGPMGSNGGFAGPVTVALSPTDVMSGVATSLYRIDGGSWQTYSGAFQVSGIGSHTVEFYSTDVAGVSEDPKSETIAIRAAQVGPEVPIIPWFVLLLLSLVAGFLVLALLFARRRRRRMEPPLSGQRGVIPPPGSG